MKSPALRLALCVLVPTLFTISPLQAGDLDELLGKLRVEVDKSAAESKTARGGNTSLTFELERNVARLETAVVKENFEEADQALTQLAVSKLTVEAKALIHRLQQEVPKAAEQRQKELVVQVGAAIEKAGKACLAAKSETELDPVLAELGALRQRRSEPSSDQRTRLNTRLDGVIRFVTRWQEFLVQRSRGYESTARGILRDLADPSSSSGNQYYPLVSREEVVVRMGKESSPEDVLRAIKTLDEIPKAVAELHRVGRENDPRRASLFDANTTIQELNLLIRAHAAFKGGSYGTALQVAGQLGAFTGSTTGAETLRLKGLLLAQLLPKHLELPDNPQPTAGENPSDYLLRLATEGVTKGDWSRVARALDAYRATAFGLHGAPAWVGADLDACQAFVAGENLAKAGRVRPAVLAFQRAMRSSGKYSPHQVAAARLADLQKEQPGEVQEASKEESLREMLEALRPGAPGAAPRVPEAGLFR